MGNKSEELSNLETALTTKSSFQERLGLLQDGFDTNQFSLPSDKKQAYDLFLQGLKGSEKENMLMAILDMELENKPTLDQRLDFIREYMGYYNATEVSGKALAALLNDLGTSDQEKMLSALVKVEWDRASASEDTENTFMRGNSLPKTAMMHHFRQELAKDPGIAAKFLEDPIDFMRQHEVPKYIQDLFEEPINDKFANKKPLSAFAYNIMFSMFTGPVLSHYGQILTASRGTDGEPQAEANYKKALAASDTLAKINAALINNSVNEMSGPMKKLVDSHITPGQVERYVESLEQLMSKISPDYNPASLKITGEVVSNFVKFAQAQEDKSKAAMGNEPLAVRQGEVQTNNPAQQNKSLSSKSKVIRFALDLIKGLKNMIKSIQEKSLPGWVMSNMQTNKAGHKTPFNIKGTNKQSIENETGGEKENRGPTPKR